MTDTTKGHDEMTMLRVTGDDGDTLDFVAPISVDAAGVIEPPPDPPIGPDPEPDAQTGVLFWWKPRVKDPDTGLAVQYARVPYLRSIVLADGESTNAYGDGDRDSYRATQTSYHLDDDTPIARVVLTGGYNDEIDSVVLDDAFSDHTKRWYDLSITTPMPTEGNDLPVFDAWGAEPGPHQAIDLRLVHRPTGRVYDFREYSALFVDPNLTVNLTETIDEPFDDHGRADPPGGKVHRVYQRQRLTIWWKGREAHNYRFDAMHADWYWHARVVNVQTSAFHAEGRQRIVELLDSE